MAIDTDTNLVSTTLNYFTPPTDGSKPWIDINADQNGSRAKNYENKEFGAVVENVRGKEDQYKLDITGFEFHTEPSIMTARDFDDESKIVDTYYPEQVELIKKLTGATRVVMFDHTIRRNIPSYKGDTPDKRIPVAQVHVDQTPSAATTRVHRHLPPTDVPSLLEKRFQIINLWRPIAHAAWDHPLALCDFRSVVDGAGEGEEGGGDLVPTTLRYPTHEGETFNVRYNPEHRWKYWKGMTPEEIVLIKCFDSKRDVALCTPHTSFVDPTTPEDVKGRESIELRALVFYD